MTLHPPDECALVERRTARARFPFARTIDGFDFSVQPMLRRASLAAQLAPEFVPGGSSLILSGKPGRGKTHLAVAIARRAIENGHDALFVRASRLTRSIARHARHGRARSAMSRYLRPGVLVLDDVGYPRHDREAASILFDVVSERHVRSRSMILTANPAPDRWGELLGDCDAAEAIVDRVLERGSHVELLGPSMRAAGRTVAAAADPGALVQVEPGEELCKRLARELVGRIGLKEAVYHLRGTMNAEALDRSGGSRRAAASLLGVDRRYVQRLVDEYGVAARDLDAV